MRLSARQSDSSPPDLIGINFRYLLGYYLEYHFAVTSAVWYVILVIGMTVLAGSAAAAKATRQSILDGIRKD